MTQQVIKRGAIIPPFPPGITSGPTPTYNASTTIDAADEVFAGIIRAPKDGNIRAVWSRLLVTTGATIRVGIYQVDTATGSPTAPPTVWAANTFIDQAITTGDGSDFIRFGPFTADATVSKGDLLAVCFIQPSASPGSCQLPVFGGGTLPYNSLYTGTWAKGTGAPMLMLEYSDGSMEIPLGSYAMGDAAASSLPQTYSLSTSTTPDVFGARFKFPFPVRVNGCWVWVDGDGDYDVKLVTADWDGASSGLLANRALAGSPNIRSGNGQLVVWVDLDDPVDLAADTFYRLLVVPTTTTAMTAVGYPCVDAAHFGAQPMAGANFHVTTAKDPNDDTDFTDYDNGTDGYRIPWMGLVLEGFSDGVGGSGVIIHPGMAGGMRG